MCELLCVCHKSEIDSFSLRDLDNIRPKAFALARVRSKLCVCVFAWVKWEQRILCWMRERRQKKIRNNSACDVQIYVFSHSFWHGCHCNMLTLFLVAISQCNQLSLHIQTVRQANSIIIVFICAMEFTSYIKITHDMTPRRWNEVDGGQKETTLANERKAFWIGKVVYRYRRCNILQYCLI